MLSKVESFGLFAGLHRSQKLDLLQLLLKDTMLCPIDPTDQMVWYNEIFAEHLSCLVEHKDIIKACLGFGVRNLDDLARDLPGVEMLLDAQVHVDLRTALSLQVLEKYQRFGGEGAMLRLAKVVKCFNLPSTAEFKDMLNRGVTYTNPRDWELKVMRLAGPLVATKAAETKHAPIVSCCAKGAKCQLCQRVEAGFSTNRWTGFARITRAKKMVDFVTGPLPTLLQSERSSSRLSSLTHSFKSLFSFSPKPKEATTVEELVSVDGYTTGFPLKPTLLEQQLASKSNAPSKVLLPILVRNKHKNADTKKPARRVHFADEVTTFVLPSPINQEPENAKAQMPDASAIRDALASSIAKSISKKCNQTPIRSPGASVAQRFIRAKATGLLASQVH